MSRLSFPPQMVASPHTTDALSSARTRITRRHALLGAASSVVLAAVTSCASGTAARSQRISATAPAAGQPLTIGMSYTPNVQFAPFYLAAANGDYADTVTLRHHGAQEGLFDALLAGTEQLVVAGADEAVVAAAGGAPLVIVGGYYQQYPGCLIVPQTSAIATLSDLAGAKVGVPGRFGENWYALHVALHSAGLTLDDITVEEIGYTQQAALVTGKVDAIVGFSNNDAVQIRLAGTPVRILDIGTDVPLVGASLVTTREMLDARRSDLTDAVRASAAGMQRFIDDPDAAVEASTHYVSDLVDPTQAANAREVAIATAALVRGHSMDNSAENNDGADDSTEASARIGSVSRDAVAHMIDFLDSHALLAAPEATVTVPSATDVCDPLIDA